ncbi:type II secretion system F family protein [Mucilaginibacter sp. FT3.2]|uniref:type II secretion system F family protein n=1 Tax=Mucilaginibacter sp. FT3.2 TaxID=2723090 RepID=UPI00161AB3AC|nr:type II secretion system F family protein [Mucilaginibacter sp. FT3.2]MBB6235283.1 type IV pilus assembly protein PilC [Mucilaginibacter sp. FT3.2]
MPAIDLKPYGKKKTPKAAQPEGEGGLLAFLNRDISFGGTELSDKKKEYLYLELSSLLLAGINLKTSMELVTAEQEKENDRKLFQGIQDNVLGKGVPFSKALEISGKFSLYEVYSIQIGEETGKLSEVLEDLAKFYQAKIKQRRKIISTLTYPCMVLLSSFGAVYFMLKVVVPMFADVLKRFGGQLPWITEMVISISKGMEAYFVPSFLLLTTIIVLLYRARKTATYRRIISGFLLRVPVVGNLIKKVYLGRFCNSMRLLISAHVPLLRAIALSKQMVGWYPIESSLQKVEDDILHGSSLHQSLQQFSVYPSKMIQLVRIGEESNKLDYFFGKIAEQYSEEVEYQTASLSSLMEPLFIIVVGFLVGVIMIAMYLPMFQMGNTFQ